MITVITPTCDRQIGINLLEKYVARQTVQPDQWIVADGGQAPAKLSMGQTHIHNPRPPGAANLTGNMLAALEAATGDAIVIMEDDDWYDPRHIERAMEGLVISPVYGCRMLYYYHIGDRRWAKFQNIGAALCQTAFRITEKGRMMASVEATQRAGAYNIDGQFWAGFTHLAIGPQTVIGMKGLPGTKGLGVGHRSHPRVHWTPDPDLVELRRWIGADVSLYEDAA